MKNTLLDIYPFLQDHINPSNKEREILPLEIPEGWYKLFLQMCADLKPLLEKADLLDKFYFVQVKEKYNYLRCYYNNWTTPEIDAVISKYEHMARNVCCICGKPAEYETTDYIASYCNDCWRDYTRHEPGVFFTPETSFKVIQFSSGDRAEKEISFKEEWERYLKENNL